MQCVVNIDALLFVCVVRWGRRYVTRVRLFYARREAITEMLQCCVRQFLSRNKMRFLRRKRAAIMLQCMWRQRLARNKKLFTIYTNAATVIQKHVRRCQAIAFCIRVRRYYAASSIQKWTKRILHRWKCRASDRIVRYMMRCSKL
jgi:hypothetical protein